MVSRLSNFLKRRDDEIESRLGHLQR
jgi:hypothetical protein